MSEAEDLFAWQLRATRSPFVASAVREYRFALPRRFRFDFAWPKIKLAVEIDGATWTRGRHTRGAGVEADCEKYCLAAIAGWRVMRFTTAMVEDGRALSLLEQALEAK